MLFLVYILLQFEFLPSLNLRKLVGLNGKNYFFFTTGKNCFHLYTLISCIILFDINFLTNFLIPKNVIPYKLNLFD